MRQAKLKSSVFPQNKILKKKLVRMSLRSKAIMKFLLFLCLVINLTFVSSSKLFHLSNITDRVIGVNFDSFSNAYVETSSGFSGNTVYKLNSRNEIVFFKKIKGGTLSLIDVNDNFYLFVYHFIGETNIFSGKGSMWRLRPYSNEFEFLFNFNCPENPVDFKTFTDERGNIIFNTKRGVGFWKPGRNPLKTIANLKGYTFHDHAIDGEGNLYLAVRHDVWKFLAVLTKKQLDRHRPEVRIFSEAEVPDSVTFWHRSIIITEFVDSTGCIKLLRNESSEVLISEENVTYGTWLTGKLLPLLIIDFTYLEETRLKKKKNYFTSIKILK